MEMVNKIYSYSKNNNCKYVFANWKLYQTTDAGGHYPPYQPGPMPGSQQQLPQQQARRLDPDQMPSAIQVMEDDKKARSGEFVTDVKGILVILF